MMTRDERLKDEVKRAIRDADQFATWEEYVTSRPTLALLTPTDIEAVRSGFDHHQTIEGSLGSASERPQE